jgi:hypothetical protein
MTAEQTKNSGVPSAALVAATVTALAKNADPAAARTTDGENKRNKYVALFGSGTERVDLLNKASLAYPTTWPDTEEHGYFGKSFATLSGVIDGSAHVGGRRRRNRQSCWS